MNKRDLLRVAMLGLAASFTGSGFAQDFPPKKAVTMVVVAVSNRPDGALS